MKSSKGIITILIATMLSAFVLSACQSSDGNYAPPPDLLFEQSNHQENETQPETERHTKNVIKGIALGDSVPAFYGVSESDGYVERFSAWLTDEGIQNSFANLAVSGLNSETLLYRLSSSAVLSQVRDADIITLNIGGNNVLTPFISMVMPYLTGMLTNPLNTNLDDFVLTEWQLASLQAGVSSFEKDFPEIIRILHTEAPNAEMFVNTVYNPITEQLGIYEDAEMLISSINKVIVDYAENGGYTVVDIYAAINASSDQVTNFDLQSSSFDIHPNKAGHTLIAEEIATMYAQRSR